MVIKGAGISDLARRTDDEVKADLNTLQIPVQLSEIQEDFADKPGLVAAPPELAQPIVGRNTRNSLRNPVISRIFLVTLAQTGRYSAAYAAAGVSAAHSLEFRNKFPEFQALCDEAIARHTGALEAEALRRATVGSAEPVYHQGNMVGVIYKKSDRLLELFLKRRDPTFRDAAATSRTTVEVNATATAQAAIGASPAAPNGLDPSRMTRAQREAYRAFLATLGAPEPAVLDAEVRELGAGDDPGDK